MISAAGWVLLVHTASTLLLVGLIWVIQLVHYPGFVFVTPAKFETFAAFHQRNITYVVMPLMLTELATAAALLILRPAAVPFWIAFTGALLLAVIWASTFLIQVPLHTQLTRGFDRTVIRKLVRTNWLRTIAWTVRGVLAITSLAIAIDLRGIGT